MVREPVRRCQATNVRPMLVERCADRAANERGSPVSINQSFTKNPAADRPPEQTRVRANEGGESLRLLAVCASVANDAHGFHSLDSVGFLFHSNAERWRRGRVHLPVDLARRTRLNSAQIIRSPSGKLCLFERENVGGSVTAGEFFLARCHFGSCIVAETDRRLYDESRAGLRWSCSPDYRRLGAAYTD